MEKQLKTQDAPISSLAKFKGLLNRDDIRQKFSEALGKKAPMFMSNLVTITSGSAELQKCEHMSIISSALMAASMDLPITPGLGFAGIVPYYDGQSGMMKAQFQVMKKGFIQLAQRTGLFKTINVCEVYEGEIKSRNRFTGDYDFDESSKVSNKIIGYVSYFRLVNGFEKYFYMPIEKLDTHAKRYSKSFQRGKGKWADREQGGYEQMCEKTVLKLNLSTYAPMSVDINMMNAVIYDQAEIKDVEGKDYDYMDNDENEPRTEKEVLELSKGGTLIIDKGTQKRSSTLTQKTVEKIDERNRPPQAQAEREKEWPSTEDHSDPRDRVAADELSDPRIGKDISAAQAESELLNREYPVREDDATPPDETESKQGYTEEELMQIDAKELLVICSAIPEMRKEVEERLGKNTNKKLRQIVLDYQNGLLEEIITEPEFEEAPSPEDVDPQDDIARGMNEGVEPNMNFDREVTEEPHRRKVEYPESNPYNIEIPELPESGTREFSEAARLFGTLNTISPPLDDKRFLEVASTLSTVKGKYSNKEDFCRRATVGDINFVLETNKEF